MNLKKNLIEDQSTVNYYKLFLTAPKKKIIQ